MFKTVKHHDGVISVYCGRHYCGAVFPAGYGKLTVDSNSPVLASPWTSDIPALEFDDTDMAIDYLTCVA
jgi:hypothetical protein